MKSDTSGGSFKKGTRLHFLDKTLFITSNRKRECHSAIGADGIFRHVFVKNVARGTMVLQGQLFSRLLQKTALSPGFPSCIPPGQACAYPDRKLHEPNVDAEIKSLFHDPF